MERGTVKSYDKSSGRGSIGRLGNTDVNFSSDRVLGRDRLHIKEGDSVLFEVDNINHLHVAINIRKSM